MRTIKKFYFRSIPSELPGDKSHSNMILIECENDAVYKVDFKTGDISKSVVRDIENALNKLIQTD